MKPLEWGKHQKNNTQFFAHFLDFVLLQTQEQYTRELLQLMETIEPGQTWKKYQLLAKLKGVLLNQSKVSYFHKGIR